MKIALYIVSAAFGGLSLLAAVSQMRSDKRPFSHIMMSVGSLGLFAAVDCGIAQQSFDWIPALAGGALICAAAVWNGKKSENFHIQHHIVRILLSLILIVGFILL